MPSEHPDAKQPLRPDFMVTLGLFPPYTVEDVRKAYEELAKTAHPDTGGDPVRFAQLQEAYERGLKYAQFYSSHQSWVAVRVDEYLQREAITCAVAQRGGHVDLEPIEWLQKDLGEDFAPVADLLVGVHLRGPQIGDETIDFLVRERAALKTLQVLDLAGSRISDEALGRLRVFSGLRRLDLRDTPISIHGLRQLLPLPHLKWLHVGGTAVSWWGRKWLKWSFPHLEVVTSSSP
jgi:hypothetical protein